LIYLPGKRVRRLNVLVVHLWSRGIDESGGESDKVYITGAEFLEAVDMMASHEDHYTDDDLIKLKQYISKKLNLG
jgi:hypothetical protein